mmetsp:Transcript_13933/g.20583  ORF Transcript_13933/g.20583 Transcript_13933/m.20583 type:complete len:438 (+) Transcript_13933:108-1421(+)
MDRNFRGRRKLLSIIGVAIAGISLCQFLLPCNTPLSDTRILELERKYRSETTTYCAKHNGSLALSRRTLTRRFPLFGTIEFEEHCPWVSKRVRRKKENCTLVGQLPNDSTEGISAWISNVAEAHLLARQIDCQLLVRYTSDDSIVDINDIFLPLSTVENWTMGDKAWDCQPRNLCFQTDSSLSLQLRRQSSLERMLPALAKVPSYRTEVMTMSQFDSQKHNYRKLAENLPGFELGAGFACSIQSLFQLSPSLLGSSHLTRLLYILHDKTNFVVSLYVRTGKVDQRGNSVVTDQQLFNQNFSHDIIECALYHERIWYNNNRNYDQVVWLVISDSLSMKNWIVKTFDGETIREGPTDRRRRIVLTTFSQSRHSRPQDKPLSKDVSEALLDWFLLGECDVMIYKGSISFGRLAALRTERPLYEAGSDTCKKDLLTKMSIV